MKEFITPIPEGYSIDTEKSTFFKIVFKETPKFKQKTWEQIVKDKGGLDTYFITTEGKIRQQDTKLSTSAIKNNVNTSDQAEKLIALAQLFIIADYYNSNYNLESPVTPYLSTRGKITVSSTIKGPIMFKSIKAFKDAYEANEQIFNRFFL